MLVTTIKNMLRQQGRAEEAMLFTTCIDQKNLDRYLKKDFTQEVSRVEYTEEEELVMLLDSFI